MSEPIVVEPGAGEVIGDAPERRVEILSELDAVHVTWSRFGPRRDGADPHVHRRHADLFYVLAGELTVRLGPQDDAIPVPAGTLARVPPLVVHGFRNATDADVRYLNLHAPGTGFADYMRALRDRRTPSFDQEPPPDDGGRPPSEAEIGGATVLAHTAELRVVLLADTPDVAIAERREAPGGAAPAAHVHTRHAESLYVLDGALELTARGRTRRLVAGTWATLPAGMAHAVAVPAGDGPARFLEVHAPSCGYGAFLRALHGGDEDARAAAGAAFDEAPVT